LQKDILVDQLGEWAAETAMKVNRSICKRVYEAPGEGPTKLYVRESINSGSEHFQIFGNNLKQRLKLG
jgi:hypothetical protein